MVTISASENGHPMNPRYASCSNMYLPCVCIQKGPVSLGKQEQPNQVNWLKPFL